MNPSFPPGFADRVPLFPLPNVVLFPHALLPLHVFEPRYRELVEDALAADGLFGLVLLLPGWESQYDGCPPIHPVACVGRIVQQERLEDGRFYLLLQGLARARIVEEWPLGDKLYRTARVCLDGGGPSATAVAREREYRKRLLQGLHLLYPGIAKEQPTLHAIMEADMPLGVLVDLICYCVNLSVEVKQRLLEEFDAVRRAEDLIAQLQLAASLSDEDMSPRIRSDMRPSDN